MLDLFEVAGARRTLRRANRLSGAGRISAATPLAYRATDRLRRLAARDTRRLEDYAASLVTLSDLHLAQVRLPAAVLVQNRLVACREELAAPPGATAEAIDLLADALVRRGNTQRLLGRYDHADTDLCRAADLARSPLSVASVLNARGILAKDTGRLEQASQHYRAALSQMRSVVGDDHECLASLFHNLAGLEHAQQRHLEGEPHARRAIRLRTRQCGPDSLEVAADLAVLGSLLAGQRRLDEAEVIFRQTLASWSRHRGPAHYEVAVSRHNLGAIHAARGDIRAAEDQYRRALAIKRTLLGDSHPEVVTLASDVAAFADRPAQYGVPTGETLYASHSRQRAAPRHVCATLPTR